MIKIILILFLLACNSVMFACDSEIQVSLKKEILEICEVLNRVNYERQKAGLNELKLDSVLIKVSEGHAKDMFERKYFGHKSPEGVSVFDRLKAAGVVSSWAGENLAKGQGSAEAAMDSWMGSPGHRSNILNSAYKKIGIGVIQRHWVQVFTN